MSVICTVKWHHYSNIMKSLLIAAVFVFGTSFSLLAQDRPVYFVQFKINSVNSIDQVKAIDKKILSKKGIISAHTDHITSTFFCTLEADAAYVFEDFESWFSKLGYEISCFNKGQQGSVNTVSPHQLKNCEENNSK